MSVLCMGLVQLLPQGSGGAAAKEAAELAEAEHAAAEHAAEEHAAEQHAAAEQTAGGEQKMSLQG